MLEQFESRPEETSEAKEKNQLTFRDLRIEDCDDMVEVVNSVVEDGAPIQRKKKTTRDEWLPVLENILKKTATKEHICVAGELDGHIVGWLAGGMVKEETEIPTAEIFTAILAKEGRAGLKNFMELAKEWQKRAQTEWGIKKVVTETQIKNRALKLYRRMGFVETGRNVRKDGDGNDQEYVELEKYLE